MLDVREEGYLCCVGISGLQMALPDDAFECMLCDVVECHAWHRIRQQQVEH